MADLTDLNLNLHRMALLLVQMRNRAMRLWIEPDPDLVRIWREAARTMDVIYRLMDDLAEREGQPAGIPAISGREDAEIADLERLWERSA